MGGRALLKYGIETRRVFDKNEYQDILSFVKSIFSNGREIYFYRSKDSWGDLDYIINSSIYAPAIIYDLIEINFNPTVIHTNAGVYSFDYKNFQIDLISKSEDTLDIAQTYFSYNDLGNLMGRIYHKFGLSYGSDGLIYPIRQSIIDNKQNKSDHIIKNILLSNNTQNIFNFGNFDYSRWSKGFENLEDIFRFVICSKYFNSDIFDFDNLNHINRIRNKKRPTYCKFVQWLKENKIKNQFLFNEDKSVYIDFIDKYFPVKFEINLVKNQYIYNKIIKSKINGHKIKKWTKKEGKEIPVILNNFKDFVDKNLYKGYNFSYSDLINNHSDRIIELIFKLWWEKYAI